VTADVAIGRLKPDDAASFKAIRLEALKANPELLRSTFELEDRLDVAWFAGRLQNAHVVGAFQNDELVGTAGFSIQEGQPNAHKGRLFGVYVRPASRNVGIGRLLLNAVLDIAREHVELPVGPNANIRVLANQRHFSSRRCLNLHPIRYPTDAKAKIGGSANTAE
jgi:GNAT superfamily N-acetyltransferase